MEANVITTDNLESFVTSIIYLAYKDLNKFMDADGVYNYLVEINNDNVDLIEEFLDFIYGDLLIYYVLDIENIGFLNEMFYNKVINIAKEIIKKNED